MPRLWTMCAAAAAKASSSPKAISVEKGTRHEGCRIAQSLALACGLGETGAAIRQQLGRLPASSLLQPYLLSPIFQSAQDHL